MRITQDQLDLLALCSIKGIDWWLLAREAQRSDGLERLLAGEVTEHTPEAQDAARLIADNRLELHEHRAAAQREVDRAAQAGAELVTVLDSGYPRTLRLIWNTPGHPRAGRPDHRSDRDRNHSLLSEGERRVGRADRRRRRGRLSVLAECTRG